MKTRSTKKPKQAGRPATYDPAFHPKSYLDLCRKGQSKAEVCAEWGIARQTLYAWSKDKRHPELMEAFSLGEELRVAWWTKFALKIANGKVKRASVDMAKFLMKNICPNDFRDRVEYTEAEIEDMVF